MTETTPEIQSLHESWLNQIRAWEKEVEAMDQENGHNSERAISKEDRKQVEHFQNQFIVQKGRLDQMKHNVKIYGGDAEKGTQEINDYAAYLNELKDEFESFCNKFS